MALLAATLYDPSTLATSSTAALLAMTAIDTTNLRLSFIVPANGSVLVRLRGATKGAGSSPATLLGVLEGAAIRGRQAPVTGKIAPTVSSLMASEACFVVTGLTPGVQLTWDAAYGVEFAVASTAYNIGGPNDTTTANNAGGFTFEVWECPNLLAATLYDPAAEVSKSVAAGLAMTALDTTNLRLAFTVPASGRVLVKIRVAVNGGTLMPSLMLGVLEGATVRCRAAGVGGQTDSAAILATAFLVFEGVLPVTGLTPGAALTWDAAYGVDGAAASAGIVYGGPDNTTQADAGGGLAYEIWAA